MVTRQKIRYRKDRKKIEIRIKEIKSELVSKKIIEHNKNKARNEKKNYHNF